jgi:hypothetical protein
MITHMAVVAIVLTVVCPGINCSIKQEAAIAAKGKMLKMHCGLPLTALAGVHWLLWSRMHQRKAPMRHTCTRAGCLVQASIKGDAAACYAHCKGVAGSKYADFYGGPIFPGFPGYEQPTC